MILSANNIFSDQQAVNATGLSTNVIDLGPTGTPYQAAAQLNADMGKGSQVPLLVQVTEDFNNLTSLKVAIEVGDTEALGTEILSETVLAADLVAGKRMVLNILPEGLDKRYVGMKYTVTGTAPTTGKITAGPTMGVQTNITGA